MEKYLKFFATGIISSGILFLATRVFEIGDSGFLFSGMCIVWYVSGVSVFRRA